MIELMDFGPMCDGVRPLWPCKCDCGECGCNCGSEWSAGLMPQNYTQVQGIIATSNYAGNLFNPMEP